MPGEGGAKVLRKTMSWGDQMPFPVSGRIKRQGSLQQEEEKQLIGPQQRETTAAVYPTAVICANCQDHSAACLLELR